MTQSWRVSLFMVLGGFVLPANAQAQSHVDAISSSQAAAGVSTENALTGEWQRLEFYTVPHPTLKTPDGRPWIEFVARRQSGRGGETDPLAFATSENCAELRNTLIWLTTLVAPRIELLGITPNESSPEGRRPIGIALDGLITTVWGRGTQPDYTANTRIELSSNGGLIAEFGRATVTNLKSCWRSE
jgi:hypothetical protein